MFEPEQQGDTRDAFKALQEQTAKTVPGATSFAALTSAQQIEVMKAMEKTPAFGILAGYTLTGCFCDPALGGNKDKVGWSSWALKTRFSTSRRSATMTRTRMRRNHDALPPQKHYKLTDVVDFSSSAAEPPAECWRGASRNGFSVVVLEQGPWLTAKDFNHDEYRTSNQFLLTNDFRKQPTTFRKTPQDKAVKQPALVYGRMVGGGPGHFTANFWRFHEIDFIEASKRERSRVPASPIGPSPTPTSNPTTPRPNGTSECQDWREPAPSILRAPSLIRCRPCR